MSKLRLRWEFVPNPNIAIAHIDDVMFRCYSHAVELDFDLKDEYHGGLSDDQVDFVQTVMAVHGVVAVGCDRYECRVTKGEVFAWQEIQPKVETILVGWLGREGIEKQPSFDRDDGSRRERPVEAD